MASLGVAPYGHPLTSYSPISSLTQPTILSTQSGFLSASGTTGSAFTSPVINNYRSPDSDNSNASVSPHRDLSETSSNSSSDSTPSSKGLEANAASFDHVIVIFVRRHNLPESSPSYGGLV